MAWHGMAWPCRAGSWDVREAERAAAAGDPAAAALHEMFPAAIR